MRYFPFAFFTVIVLLLSSCGSSKHISDFDEKQKVDIDAVSCLLSGLETVQTVTDEGELREIVEIETTVYDTSRLDSLSGTHPVLSKTKTTKTREKGDKKTSKTQKNANISATNEESAKINQVKNEKREVSATETKQPLYVSYILLGIASVVLVCVLAYWVFSKYRAEKLK